MPDSTVETDIRPRGGSDSGSSLIDTRIVSRSRLSETVVALELTACGDEPLPGYVAGAHVDVHVTDGIVRQYSLCGNPQARGRYRIGVHLDPNSRGGSAEVHRSFHVGRVVKIGQPRCAFALAPASAPPIMVAGGIGVTPILAMAYALDAEGKDFHLHYCTRSPGHAAFLDEMRHRFGSRVQAHFGLMVFDPLEALRDAPGGTHVYTCGPVGLMEAVASAARAVGWRAERVHQERFSSDLKTFSAGTTFDVVARRSGVMVSVQPTQTIAEALLAAGVRVPLSCGEGLCGSCLTRVLEGTPEHRDSCLSDVEHAEGTLIAPCCSRSATPRLVLDI